MNPKTGKTTIATQFPKSLLLAAEKGYNALAGIKAQPIHRWSDFKKVLRQLSNPKAKEMYESIVCDTIDLFWDMCEQYICNREGVQLIGDIPYGAGYKMLRTEFNEALRSIPMMDYGLVMISHATVRTVTDSSGAEYSRTMSTLPNRPREIVSGMSDIIGYAEGVMHEGVQKTVLHLRETPRFEAGSRYKYMSPVIPFEYHALVDDIVQAIEKEEEEKGASAVTDEFQNAYDVPEEKTFKELSEEIQKTLSSLVEDKDEEEQASTAKQITKIIETHLGKNKMLKDTTEEQRDHVELILLDLQDLLETK